MANTYSTQNISTVLVDDIVQALRTVSPYGSVEIYIQNNTVTQITMRNIKKTNPDGHGLQTRPYEKTSINAK